jgi:hypothetical protein
MQGLGINFKSKTFARREHNLYPNLFYKLVNYLGKVIFEIKNGIQIAKQFEDQHFKILFRGCAPLIKLAI